MRRIPINSPNPENVLGLEILWIVDLESYDYELAPAIWGKPRFGVGYAWYIDDSASWEASVCL